MAASVLYVDDDRSLCQIVSKALRADGYAVRLAYDGDEAIASIREDPPDLLLLGLLIPRRDGFEVLETLRRQPPPIGQLPVVLLSSCSPTPAYHERSQSLGASKLLTKPVPLDELLGTVVGIVGEAKRDGRDPSAAPGRRRASKDRAIAGRLDRVSFPAVLHHLHGMRATGVLHLTSGKKRKWIQLRDGYPVAVRSNLMRETLGAYLERTGRISRAVLEESKEHLKRGMRQGEILVAMDLLTEEQVADVLREQADEKLFEIFGWQNGSFRFERNARLQRANTVGLGRSPANLILEGVRSRFPIERIDRYLASNGRRRVGHSEAPFYRFQDLHVDASEEPLLRGLDGTQRLASFAREEESLRRTVYGLIAAGFLELSSSPREAPAKVSEAERAARVPCDVDASSHRDPRQDEPEQLELMNLAEQLRAKDHFGVLGVDQDAGPEQLRSAYAELSSRTHPDHYSDASQAVRDLAADVHGLVETAYSTLTDPRSRQEYLLARRKIERQEQTRLESEKALEAETEFRKGETALNAREYEMALAHFGRALQLYPEEGDHHAHYGWTLYLCHPDEPQTVREALEHVKRGLKLSSHREKPYLFMGRLYKAVGQVEVAERMFTRAVQEQPECVEALRELRIIHMRRERSRGLIGRLFRR
jgi:CheY-like chemotaxis protein